MPDCNIFNLFKKWNEKGSGKVNPRRNTRHLGFLCTNIVCGVCDGAFDFIFRIFEKLEENFNRIFNNIASKFVLVVPRNLWSDKEKFREGFLTVWDLGERGNQFVSAPSGYTFTNGDTTKTRKDVVFDDIGTYVSGGGEVNYPFANLMREEVRGIEYGEQGTTIRSDLVGVNPTRSDLLIPGWKVGDIVRIEYRDGEAMPSYFVNGEPGPIFMGKEKPEEGKNYFVARVSDGEEWREYLSERRYGLQGLTLKVEVPTEPQIYDFGEDGQGTSGNCDVLKRGSATKSQITNSPILKLGQAQYVADQRGAACD